MFGRAGRSLLHPFSDRQYDTSANSSPPPCRRKCGMLCHGGMQRSAVRSLARRALGRPVRSSYIPPRAGMGWESCAIKDGYPRARSASAFTRSHDRDVDFPRNASPVILRQSWPPRVGHAGSCATVIRRVISSVFRNVEARFDCAVWIEFAHSGLNKADLPSRTCSLIPLIPVWMMCLLD